MKRLLAALTLGLLVSLALGVSVANATHSNGQGPKQDLASGTGELDVSQLGYEGVWKVHVNAQSDPSGGDARGHFYFENRGPSFEAEVRGRVTCLNVVGNMATIGGEIERSENPATPPEGSGVLLFVEDVEEGEGDKNSGVFTQTPPEVCPPPVEPALPTAQGNFIVHDATP